MERLYTQDFECCCCGKTCLTGQIGGGGNPEPLKDEFGNCLARLSNDNVVCEVCDEIVVVYMRKKLWNLTFVDDPRKLIDELVGKDRYDEYINLIRKFEENEEVHQAKK
jgi:hypothetical protein